MRIFDETKTKELIYEALDFEKGYLKPDKLFVKHHKAVEAQEAVYIDRIEVLKDGNTQTWKEVVSPAIEAKDAYDEYEDIQIYNPYTEAEFLENRKARLRLQREKECFPIINRGELWYKGLTELQLLELESWYKAWLDVTKTLTAPNKPVWLK